MRHHDSHCDVKITALRSEVMHRHALFRDLENLLGSCDVGVANVNLRIHTHAIVHGTEYE